MTKQNKNNSEIHQQIINIDIIIALCALLIFMILWTLLIFNIQAPYKISDASNSQESFQQEDNKRDFAQLHRYHGYPAAVIVEEGKTPYFYDKRGRKVAFVYPSKRVRQITHQAENSEQYAALTPEKEPEVNDNIFLFE